MHSLGVDSSSNTQKYQSKVNARIYGNPRESGMKIRIHSVSSTHLSQGMKGRVMEKETRNSRDKLIKE